MTVDTPVYRVELWSGSTNRFSFGYGATDYIKDLKVKPGITNAIASFEVNVPDSNSAASTGGKYLSVLPYEDVYIWLGYDITGSNAILKGKIDTIRSRLSAREGFTRSFIGRDYGEALFRILKRIGYTGSAFNAILNLLASSGLNSSQGYIMPSANEYPMVLENDDCFRGLKDISDLDNTDFYVDRDKKLHLFTRQIHTGSESFVVGTNILEYAVDKDIMPVYNDIFVFGMRDSSDLTGSDIPNMHDANETGSPGLTWEVGHVYSGSSADVPLFFDPTEKATGSSSFLITFDTVIGHNATGSMIGAFNNTPVMINSGDVVHFYTSASQSVSGLDVTNARIRLRTDASNYYECLVEDPYVAPEGTNTWEERTIELGPSYEGPSVTGSTGPQAGGAMTGSYRWNRVGYPDWYNINSVNLLWTTVSTGSITSYLRVDGFYIGTRFQAKTGSIVSSGSYGYRPHVIMSEKFNSNQYCLSEAQTVLAKTKDPIVQIQLTVTGSASLQVGTKYTTTIPAENINDYYELIDLEHRIVHPTGFTSTCTLTNQKEIRTPVPLLNYPALQAIENKTLWEIILDMFKGKPGKRIIWLG